MILWDESKGKPKWLGCMRSERLSFTRLGKAFWGKAKVKTGIGKSDLPGLQGGPRKRDFVLMTKGTRLGPIPTPGPFDP